MFFGGITQNKGVQLSRTSTPRTRTIKLFGPDGVAESAFTREDRLGVREEDVHHQPDARPEALPAGRRRTSSTKFKEKFGNDPEPYAIYGYEAMKVALLAIQNAGDKGNDRQAVIDAFFKIKDRDSVLGKYSIDENGDTTLSDYGANRVEGGKLVVRQGDQGPDQG